jgi:predicted RNA-binding protein YlqC (UPF0109 family)
MLEEALRHLVQGIVDHPEDVSVTEKNQRRGKCLDVRVNPVAPRQRCARWSPR